VCKEILENLHPGQAVESVPKKVLAAYPTEARSQRPAQFEIVLFKEARNHELELI
jgi:hypothetical protein